MFKKTLAFLLIFLQASVFAQKDIFNSDSIVLPRKTTAQRDALTGLMAGQVLYNSSSKKVNQYNGTAWAEVGSGAGGINYISGGDAESGTGGWATYADAAATTPVDCTGGAPAVTWTTTSSSPLRDSNSFLYTRDAANRQGQGASYAFTIASADQAKVLTISFEYGVASGTWQPGSSSQDSDVEPYIYDVTNAVVIQPAGYKLTGGSTGAFKYSGTFQTASNSTSYRLCLHTATTVAAALTVKLDTVSVGPTGTAMGSASTDWVAYTPTGAWVSNTTYTGFWRRDGDTMEVEVKAATSGAPTSATFTASIPSGYTIDTTKLVNTTSQDTLGTGYANDSGTAYKTIALYTTTTTVSGAYQSAVTGAVSFVTQIAPFTFGAGDYVILRFRVPISGWGSSVTMSNDTDTRVVAVELTGSTSTLTAGSDSTITPTTIVRDTHGAFSTATFTAPVFGFYQLEASVTGSSQAHTLAQNVNVGVKINGAAAVYLNTNYLPVTASYPASASGSSIRQLNAGDTVVFVGNFPVTTTASSFKASIFRLTGPATVAATESVIARYFATATSISGALATISWTTKDKDTHGGMSSGTYTLPIAGTFQVNACIAFSAGSAAAGNAVDVQLQKNGTVSSEVAPVYQSTQVGLPVCIDDVITGVAGDTIRIQASSAATSPAITSSNSKNFFSIFRVGN